jgi:hypothetical protein
MEATNVEVDNEIVLKIQITYQKSKSPSTKRVLISLPLMVEHGRMMWMMTSDYG